MWNKGKTFGIFALFFLIWEGSSRLVGNLHFVLPAPSMILHTLFERKGRLLFHTLITLKEMGGGFALAFALALPLAYLMFRFKSARDTLQPFFLVLQSLPMFTLAPLMVIWFGWGYTAIVIPTALMIFLPLTLNMYQGLRQTPSSLLEFFAINGATEKQTFFKLRFRFALPYLFSGLRIAAAVAGVGSVAGEWAGGQNGLGVLMLESRRNTDLELTFAALFCLTTLSFALYGFIVLAERALLKQPQKGSRPRKTTFLRPARWALSLGLLAITPLFFFSCQHSSKKPTRLLLDWLPNPNHVPLFVGLEKGYFKEAGVDLVLQKVHEAGHGITYLTSHQCDLLISHLPETLKTISKGANVTIVGSLIQRPLRGLTFARDLPVDSPKDLSGLRLGYTIGETNAAFLQEILDTEHIVPKSERNVSFDLVACMATRHVDFVYGGFWNIEPLQLKHLGLEVQTFKIEEFNIPTYQELIILASGDTPMSEAPFVKAFSKALQKSIDYCKQHPDEAFDLYVKNQKDLGPKGMAWEKEAWDVTCPLLTNTQAIDPQVIEEFTAWLEKKNILSNPIDKNILTLL